MRGIKEEAARIEATLNEHWLHQAAARQRKLTEQAKPPPFNDGDLVMCSKPFYERGTGVILPQADGPFLIEKVLSGHTCVLKDAITHLPYMNGARISLSRLIKFNYPVDFITTEEQELPPGVPLEALKVGSFVAVETKLDAHTQVFVARVNRKFTANRMLEVDVYQIPTNQRYGPWNRRVWELRADAMHVATRIIVPDTELLCEVSLVEGALSELSLEKLARLGVDVGSMPSRDKAIPARAL